ncbi:MAG: ferrous iron transport protein B [Desulfuromonas sp.]|mgnify:CR=1 FL=1|nr:MAG: ferrous iron transport protein B [Desulfuromonas sp.]
MNEPHDSMPRVVLVGNPNVGKSVLFNALTGAYTTVSNYPGTSVEISRGTTEIQQQRYEVLDTPGMYALLPISEEERVAQRILLNERADVVVHVVDARNLERMLPMTLQLAEAGLPLVLVVNILDEAKRLGMEIDLELLEQRLGIPVVGAVMAKRQGLTELKEALSRFHRGSSFYPYATDLERDICKVAALLNGEYRLSSRSLSILLMKKDEEVVRLVREVEGEGYQAVDEMVRDITFERRSDLHLRINLERRRIVNGILDGVIRESGRARLSIADWLSHFAIDPWTGVPLLLLVLYFGLYQFVGGFGAGTVVDFFEGTIFEGHLNPWLIGLADRWVPWPWLYELLVGEYGIFTLAVRYAVALVMPIVGTFFIAFSVLEDSGYFPRLAMLVDRVMKKIGLNGRAVIPMVLGFGCDTMATMVTRTLETKRERVIATVLLALAIPCSAQLGVILGLLSTVTGALAVWVVVMVAVFLLVGLLTARLLPGEAPIFYMELPPMRLPQLRNVLVKTLTRMHWYFLEIFPLFILASLLLWAGKMSGLLDMLVRGMYPAMHALGLPAEASAAFIFGFFRRDFGAAGLYDLQTSGLLDARQLTVAAVTLTLFVPCVAQFLVMKKERGWRVALGIFVFVSVLAFAVGAGLNVLLLATGLLS